MKKLVLAVFLFTIAHALPAQKQKQAQWREYVFAEEDGFAITLPSPPNPHNDNGDRHIKVYSVRLGTTVFTLRAVSRAMDCETGLAEMWDDANRKDRREPVIPGTLKQVSLAGMQGLEYETDLGSGQRSLHRFHCADSRKFYIFNAGYQGKQRPAELMRIINSFRLVSPSYKQ